MEKNSEKVYWILLNHKQWNMYIGATTEGVCYVSAQNAAYKDLETWVKKRLSKHELTEDTDVLQPYAIEFINYLEGRCKNFSLPIDLHGTAFQRTVWKALQEIPYGQTVSYYEIAEHIQKPSSVRAVGTAIGANPALIIVPCHRVIAKSGKLSGYRGGIEMKEQLLGLEN